ncbi:hypothetical protein ABT093_03265 [Kitasatospora sp. NPDC002551]|uniref:hypothetical protein n=1 Tax=Kitasatospora sp. NPDC002551 TaxID=3154539 RepID=UPI00331DC24D
MIESWVMDDDSGAPVPALPGAVPGILRSRIDAECLETWLSSSAGRSLGFVTNGEQAMVLLLEGEGDPGEHAVDPSADGESDGFLLANGQCDEYPDRDTVPLPGALRIVDHIVTTGSWPSDAPWVADR